jgi:hypothetical protein
MLEGRRVLSTLTVTSNSDDPFGNTLRNEITAAQPGDTIVFDPSLNGQTITLGASQLEINKNLTIQGPGAGLLAISGGGNNGSRVFQVDAGANVTIIGLTIEDGYGEKYNNQWSGMTGGNTPDRYDGCGGGILNLGTLTLSGCTVTGNNTGTSSGEALGPVFAGGGIFNNGTMTLNGCTVTGNSAVNWALVSSFGGGIYNNGTMTLSGCTVTGDSATRWGGGLYAKGGGIFNDTQGHLIQGQRALL